MSLSLVIASVVIVDIALNAGLVYVLAHRRAPEERLRLIRSSVSFVRGRCAGMMSSSEPNTQNWSSP
jgi:hypothetical protein